MRSKQTKAIRWGNVALAGSLLSLFLLIFGFAFPYLVNVFDAIIVASMVSAGLGLLTGFVSLRLARNKRAVFALVLSSFILLLFGAVFYAMKDMCVIC